MTAVWYAVICLVFAAGNDLLFKFFSRRERSRGVFCAVIGAVWMVYCILTCGEMPSDWKATLLWGSVSGFFSIGGNLLLIGAMKNLSAGLCSTIYRLNLVPTVLGAWLLLGEHLSAMQWLGAALAVAAVLAFVPKKGSGREQFSWSCFIMVICGAFMRAGMGLSYRYGFSHGADREFVVLINSLFWIIGGVIWYLATEHKKITPDWQTVKYGVVSGLLVTGIVVFMALSLQYGNAAVVLPVAQMSFLLTGAAGAIFLKEKFTIRTIAAFLCGCGAVLILSIFS